MEIGVDECSGAAADMEKEGVCAPRYHTPHSCRHTFSRLCESYGVNEADRKRMMGRSLLNDVTNGVYGHRSVIELARELEKIEAGVDAGVAACDARSMLEKP